MAYGSLISVSIYSTQHNAVLIREVSYSVSELMHCKVIESNLDNQKVSSARLVLHN